MELEAFTTTALFNTAIIALILLFFANFF